MEKTKISWTDYTWNPWRGCRKVSAGCTNCYMFRDQKRYGKDPLEIVRAAPPTFNKPLSIKEPSKIFTCSWSDFFIEEADEWRDEAWEIIKSTPQHTYQILTKRPERIDPSFEFPDNVWLGVTVEGQKTESRLPILSGCKAKVKFISYEPALEIMDFSAAFRYSKIDWVIAGGESGPGYRPADPDWFIWVQEQCKRYGIPFWFKQHGGTKKIDGVAGGDRLNGQIYQEFPR